MELFDSTKRNLFEILKDVQLGKIQLPDFQRGWVWDDHRIIDLLTSVAKSFPIGAIMLLKTGNPDVKFKTKLIEGVQNSNPQTPENLILDGQQRITSLFQTLFTQTAVQTKNSKGAQVSRWYYIDMVKALDEQQAMDEAIFSVKVNKIITENIGRDIVLDLSNEQQEFKNCMFPINKFRDPYDWRASFKSYWEPDQVKSTLWDNFEKGILRTFDKYNLPIIELFKENPKEAVCQVFEKVNTGGVSLTIFELLTATYASDDYDLKEDWKEIRNKFSSYKLLSNTSNTDIIQSITLLSTYDKRGSQQDEVRSAVSARRKDMLALTLGEYRKYRDIIVQGYINASKILQENHIYNARDLPYSTQLVPMAAILAKLGNQINTVGNKQKLMRWFWCGVFGELYGSAIETRYALDLTQMFAWITKNGEEPKTIYEANFVPSRLLTLRTRNSAAYKGVYALLLSGHTKDWLSATQIDFSTYFSEAIDIHHIFPVRWCGENRINWLECDSIINKTPLSERTNRKIGGDAPSKYLEKLKNEVGVSEDEFNSILKTHLVDPDLMKQDDFHAFFEDRKEQILKRIESAMGKTISRNMQVPEEGTFVDEESENPEYSKGMESSPKVSPKSNKFVTGLYAIGLTFNGTNISVKSWRDVLNETLNILYDLDPVKFEEFALKNPTFLSKVGGKFKTPKIIRGTYFAESQLNAQTIFNFCKRAIKYFDFSEEQWFVKAVTPEEYKANSKSHL